MIILLISTALVMPMTTTEIPSPATSVPMSSSRIFPPNKRPMTAPKITTAAFTIAAIIVFFLLPP